MPGPQSELDKLQARQEAILAGLQNERAMMPTDEELARGPSSLEGLKGAGSYSYEYEDPEAPGAAPGRQEGPMAHELRPLGVTHMGPDGMERVDAPRLAMKSASAIGELARSDSKKNDELERLRNRMDILSEQIGANQDDPDAVLREARSGRY